MQQFRARRLDRLIVADADIVDQYVKPPLASAPVPPGIEGGDQRLDRSGLADLALDGKCLPACGLDGPDHVRSSLGVASIVDGDQRTRGCEALGDAAPDAA